MWPTELEATSVQISSCIASRICFDLNIFDSAWLSVSLSGRHTSGTAWNAYTWWSVPAVRYKNVISNQQQQCGQNLWTPSGLNQEKNWGPTAMSSGGSPVDSSSFAAFWKKDWMLLELFMAQAEPPLTYHSPASVTPLTDLSLPLPKVSPTTRQRVTAFVARYV